MILATTCGKGHQDWYTAPSGKRGCRGCRNAAAKRHYRKNSVRIMKTVAARYWSDPERSRLQTKKRREANPELFRSREKTWRQNNREKRILSDRDYYDRNKIHFQKKRTAYLTNKRRTDPEEHLRTNLRSRLYQALKRGRARVKLGSAVRDLGCSLGELMAYLEAKFQTGMSWANYGQCWHVDHVQPLSSFKLTIRRQLLKAVHYSNLQPLWAEDNLRKGPKLDFLRGSF